MGVFDLLDEPDTTASAPTGSAGKFDLLDPPKDPRFVDDDPAQETRPFKGGNTGPDLPGQMAEAAKFVAGLREPPGMAEAAGRGAVQGASLGFGDEIAALVDYGVSKVPLVRDAAGAIDKATGGSGAGLPIDDPTKTYQERRDSYRGANRAAEDAHPVAYGAGEIGGGLATSVVPGATAVRGAGAVRAGVTAAKIGAASAAGNSTADLTQGEIGQFATDVGTGTVVNGVVGAAAGRLVRGAPERVDRRLVANISRGEGGGAAKDKLYKNFILKAGEEFGDLNEVLARHPGVKDTLVTTAAANPAKGAKVAGKVVDTLDAKLAPIYQAIDKGPAVPRATDLQNRLMGLEESLRGSGQTLEAGGVRSYIKHIAENYGDGDAVRDEVKLTGSMLRKLKQGIGQAAFATAEERASTPAIAAKRMIYGAINDTIEEAGAKTPGVDISKLRELNKDASLMISVRDVLADRGAKDASGRTSLFQNLLGAGAAGGALASAAAATATGHGGVGAMLAAPVVAYGAKKAVNAGVGIGRHADLNLAKMVQAARAGSVPAQIGQAATEVGAQRVIGDAIAQNIPGGINDREAKDRAVARVISAAQSGADTTDVLTQAEAAGLSPFEAATLVSRFAPKRQEMRQ